MKLVHIVFFNVSEGDNMLKKHILDSLKSKLEGLQSVISEIQKLEVGSNISNRGVAWDMALNTEFPGLEALEVYQNHPQHIQVLEWIKSQPLNVAVVDYWVS